MAITFGNIGLAEPSTITKVVASVVIARGSTNEHQEVLVIGDPSDSLAMARVLAAKPASTEYAQVVRNVETVFNIGSTAADNVVTIGVVSAGAGRLNIGSTAADNVVRAIFSSTNTDNPVRPVFSSTGADNPVVITAGNSSVIITSIAAGAGRLNIGSTAADNVVTIGTISAGAGRINIGSTAADNVVRAIFSSTNTDNPVRAILSSTNTDNPVRAILSSTKADNLITVYQSSAAELLVTATIGTNLQSTSAPSSGSSGLVVRQVIDGLTTFASTTALASTVLSCASSVANVRFYVTAFTITSTNQTPAQWGFYSSNATLLWPMTIAALSSAVSGMNLAVGAPGYLFRTAVNEALNFKTNGSTVVGVQLGVSYFTAP